MNQVIKNRNGEPLTLEATEGGEVRVIYMSGHARRHAYLHPREAHELARALQAVASEASANGKAAHAMLASDGRRRG